MHRIIIFSILDPLCLHFWSNGNRCLLYRSHFWNTLPKTSHSNSSPKLCVLLSRAEVMYWETYLIILFLFPNFVQCYAYTVCLSLSFLHAFASSSPTLCINKIHIIIDLYCKKQSWCSLSAIPGIYLLKSYMWNKTVRVVVIALTFFVLYFTKAHNCVHWRNTAKKNQAQSDCRFNSIEILFAFLCQCVGKYVGSC